MSIPKVKPIQIIVTLTPWNEEGLWDGELRHTLVTQINADGVFREISKIVDDRYLIAFFDIVWEQIGKEMLDHIKWNQIK